MFYLILFYLIFILGFVIYSAAGIYHLWRFGYSGDLSKVIIVIYVLTTAAIIVISLLLLSLRIL